VLPTDNFDTLELRSDELVLELFIEAWPRLRAGDLSGVLQEEDLATYHSWEDCKALRRLDVTATMKVKRVLDILRAYSGAQYTFVEFQLGLDPSPYRVRAEVLPGAGRTGP